MFLLPNLLNTVEMQLLKALKLAITYHFNHFREGIAQEEGSMETIKNRLQQILLNIKVRLNTSLIKISLHRLIQKQPSIMGR